MLSEASISLKQELGLRLVSIEADTLLCADYRPPRLWCPILITVGLPLYKTIDRLLANRRPFSYFGWEVWFAATKVKYVAGLRKVHCQPVRITAL